MMLVFGTSRMRLTLLVIIVSLTNLHGKVIKKSQKELSTVSEESTKPSTKKIFQKPAIIAIEIVDPNENSTRVGKGRKRTIDSSLGYGYQNFFNVQPKAPKYEVYKYSQHDIPPFKGHQTVDASKYNHKGGNGDFQITKSLQYDLGSTKPEYIPHRTPQESSPNLQQYYQPGTTLFSTVDQNGHLGGLSSQVPQGHHSPMVPVIILRVYTNQLSNSGALHPNIPQNHPYANLNTLDLQNLLSGYIQNQYPEPQGGFQGYNYDPPQNHQPQIAYKQNDGLQTHENYPDEAHTKVIFHKEGGKSAKKPKSSNKISASYKAQSTTYKTTPQKFKITVPENTFSKIEVQDHTYNGAQDQNYNGPQEHNYNGAQDQHQLYYYPAQGQEQYVQDYQQEQYQQYQDPKQYIPVATYPQAQQEQNYHYNQQQYQDTQQYVQYQEAYREPQNSPQHQYYAQPNQDYAQHTQNYVQPTQDYAETSKTYQQQTYTKPQQEYHQPQYDQSPQQYDQQYAQPGPEYEQISQNDPQTSQDYTQQKASSDAGRDLHPKVYNYHAHGIPKEEETSIQPVHTPKARSTKKRRVRLPLVLAPKGDKEKEESH